LRVRQLAAGAVDWRGLLDLALRQGVMPLLHTQLNAVCPDLLPADFLARLHDHFLLNAARNLTLTLELCRVQRMLAHNGIHAITYKGPVLASTVYGDISQRQFSDLDLMVRREEMSRVAALLKREGYVQQWHFTSQQEKAYLNSDCERLFTREGRIFIDVHWAVIRSYFPLRMALDLYRTRLQSVSLESCALRTFAPADQLVILCVHASKDLWARLVWVCDIAEMLLAHPQLNLEQVLIEARRTKTSRMLLLGLSLAHHLLGAALPFEILAIIKADETIQGLTGEIKTRLSMTNLGTERPFAEFGFHLKLMQGLRQKISYTTRYWTTTNPADWDYVRLPDDLFFLYPVLRPLRLLHKRWR
jgi:hypothetical protein